MRINKGFFFGEKKTRKGFTLIELLVVVSIIGMLTALIMVNFNAARERARDVERKSDLDQIKKALRMYYNDVGTYPAHSSDNKIVGCGTGASPATCNWGSGWTRQTMTYMKVLPQDPSYKQAGDPSYNYSQVSPGQDFLLSATLENKSDSDICKSQTHCGIASCDQALGQYVVCAD